MPSLPLSAIYNFYPPASYALAGVVCWCFGPWCYIKLSRFLGIFMRANQMALGFPHSSRLNNLCSSDIIPSPISALHSACTDLQLPLLCSSVPPQIPDSWIFHFQVNFCWAMDELKCLVFMYFQFIKQLQKRKSTKLRHEWDSNPC